jgi:hypothetical protein
MFCDGCAGGDFDAVLNIYEEWVSQGRSESWCSDNMIDIVTLQQAGELLVKVHQSLQKSDIPLSNDTDVDNRSAKILKAFAAVMPDNIAIASDPSNCKEGFRLVSCDETNPTLVKIQSSSAVISGQNVDMIVFMKRNMSRGNGPLHVSWVAKVSEQTILEAKDLVMGGDSALFDDFKKQLGKMKHEKKRLVFGKFRIHELSAFLDNVKEIQREFKRAIVRIMPRTEVAGVATAKLYEQEVEVICPRDVGLIIEKKLAAFVDLSRDAEQEIENVEPSFFSGLGRWFKANGSLELVAQKRVAALKEKYFLRNLIVEGDSATKTVKVRTVGILVGDVVRDLTKELVAAADSPPAAAGADAASIQRARDSLVADQSGFAQLNPGGIASNPAATGIPSAPSASASFSFDARKKLLLTKGTTPREIIQACGLDRGGGYMLLAHVIVWKTSCWIYGGFLRDFVINGDAPESMDLDIGLPLPADGTNLVSALQQVDKHIRGLQNGVTITYKKHAFSNPAQTLLEAEFAMQKGDGSEEILRLQFVDTKAFPAQCESDVSNLKVVRKGNDRAELAVKYENQPPGITVDQICRNVGNRIMSLNARMSTVRMDKFRKRGWKLAGQGQ